MAEPYFLNSDAVIVFPETNRTTNSRRILTESAITDVLKCTCGNEVYGYIVSINNNTASFVLEGYYFEVNLLSLANKKNIYVTLDTYGGSIKGDLDNLFEGLKVYDSPPNNTRYLTLRENGSAPANSFFRFSGNELPTDFGILETDKKS